MACADAERRPAGSEVNRRQIVAHFHGIIAAVVRIAKTELTEAIKAPAFDGGIVQQCTDVLSAHGNSDGGLARSKVDREQVVAHGGRNPTAMVFVALAKLPVVIDAPALQRAVVENGARGVSARREERGGFSGAEVDRWEVVAHLPRSIAPIGAIADAQKAQAIDTPAFHVAVVEHCASVSAPYGHGHRSSSGSQVDHGQIAAHFTRTVTACLRIALTKLSGIVETPALEAIVRRARAGKFVTDRDLGYAFADHTSDSITRIPDVASAGPRSWRIRAGCIDIAAAIVREAFIDVGASVSIAAEAGIADTHEVRASCIRAAIGVRCARGRSADAGAIANIGSCAFIVRVALVLDEATNAVVASSLFRRRAGVTRSAAMIAAAYAVDAIIRQALRGLGTRRAVVELADANSVACSVDAFAFRIEIVFDRAANTVRSLTLFCSRTRHAKTRACRVATNSIDTLTRQTLRSRAALRAIGQVRRGYAGPCAITFAVRTFVLGIDPVLHVRTRAIRALTSLGCGTSHAARRARSIAANAVYAPTRCALRGQRTRRAIGALGLRLRTTTRAIAGARVAFIVRIVTRRNLTTYAVRSSAAFFRRRACLARSRADVATAKTIDAVGRKTLARGRTRGAVVITTSARSIALSAVAFEVRIAFGRDDAARPVHSLAFFGRGAGKTGAGAGVLATHSIDAIARYALRASNTRRSIGQRRLRQAAGASSIALARRTFAVSIASVHDGAAYAIESLALLGLGTGITPAGTDVAATHAVDAIIRQTLGLRGARHAVVLLADRVSIASAAPALFVRVEVVRDGPTHTIDSLAFFRGGACLARPEAPAVAAYAVCTKPGGALGRRRTRSSIGRLALRECGAGAGSIAFTGITLAVRISSGSDGSAYAVRAAAFFRSRTRLARSHADIAAAKSIDAIIRQTLRCRVA